jgi:hypothetical protein
MPSPGEVERQRLEELESEPKDTLNGLIRCNVYEYDGPREWGEHCFLHVPRIGEVIELWAGTDEEDLTARVKDVRHMEVDEDSQGGDIDLFVEDLFPKKP